ncbi:hypothetical protein NP493_1387g00023 [Ridgeia piscesae]|uniref:Protein quiver n=1 Tax=Ridgeia piscesae TaxID=27915 RepID=A0AAD9NC90_RIDPI|nr:hypothetical protein NP493_1387g00023 [Ridgeia piscesae]
MEVSSIGCFVCTSINGSEPDCEDTFNNTGRFYQNICMGGKRGHAGLFPGSECIKIKATLASTGYTVMVRHCHVDTGGVNSETELGRESHCWLVNMIIFDGVDMRGCSLACRTDGCNGAERTLVERTLLVTGVFLAATLCYFGVF